MPDGEPNPVDVHVGARVRLRRVQLHMSQEKLGEAIGLTFQQVQKYERGANRIGASRLFCLSRTLGVPVSYFYDDMPPTVSALSPRQMSAHYAWGCEPPAGFEAEPAALGRRETVDLISAFHRISNPQLRQLLLELARALAAPEGEGPEGGR